MERHSVQTTMTRNTAVNSSACRMGYAFHILLFVMVMMTVQMAVMRQLQNVQEVCVYVCSCNTYSETTVDNVWMLEK